MAEEVIDFKTLVFRLYDLTDLDPEDNITFHLKNALQVLTSAIPKQKADETFTSITKCFDKISEDVLKNGFDLALAKNDITSAQQCLEYMKISGAPDVKSKINELSNLISVNKYGENMTNQSFIKKVRPRYSRSVSPRSLPNSDHQYRSITKYDRVKLAMHEDGSPPRYPSEYKSKKTHRSRRSISLCDGRSVSPKIYRATKTRESISPHNHRYSDYRKKHRSRRSLSPCNCHSRYQKSTRYAHRSKSPKNVSMQLKNNSKHRSRSPYHKGSHKPISNKRRSLSYSSASEDELSSQKPKSHRPKTGKVASKQKASEMKKRYRSDYESDSESEVEERSYKRNNSHLKPGSPRKKQKHSKPTSSKNPYISDSSPSPQRNRNKGSKYIKSSTSASSSDSSDNENYCQGNSRRSLSESELLVPKSKTQNKTNSDKKFTKTFKSCNSLNKPNDSRNNSLFLGRLKELEASVLNGNPDPLSRAKKKGNSKKSPAVAKSKKSTVSKSKKSPTVAKSKNSPAVAKNEKSSAVAKSKKSPASVNSKKPPALVNTKKSSDQVNSKKSPAPVNSKKSPAVTNNKKSPAVNNKKQAPQKTKKSPAVPKDKKPPPKKVKKGIQDIQNNKESPTVAKPLNNKNLPSSLKDSNRDLGTSNKNVVNKKTNAPKKQPAKKKGVNKNGAQTSKTTERSASEAKENDNKRENVEKDETNDKDKEHQIDKEEVIKENGVDKADDSGDGLSSDDDCLFDSEPELATLSACLNSIKRKQPRALGSATPPMKIFLSPHTSSIMSPASSVDSFADLTVKIDDKNVVKRMAKANKPKETKNTVDDKPEKLKSTPEALRKAMKIQEKITNDADSEVECSSFMSDNELGVDE